MGFFDFCCPISGLSLRGQRAVHIALVEETPGRWSPLSLPIEGSYDRLGSIDFIEPDELTAIFVSGFAWMARAGRVQAPSVPHLFAEFTRAPQLERLLKTFAQVNTDSAYCPMPFTLDGRQLRQVLIHAEVFAALAPVATRARAPEYEELEEQLARAPLAPQGRELFEEVIIGSDAARIRASAALSQLSDFDRRIAAVGRRWSPEARIDQLDNEIDLDIAREARARLGEFPELADVIDRAVVWLEAESAEDAEWEAWRAALGSGAKGGATKE